MSSARWRRVAAMKGRAARRRLRHPAKTEWRVASEVGVASGQWPVASESGGSGERQVAPGGCGGGEPECSEPTQERCLATEKAPNKANLESHQVLEPQLLKSETAGAEGRKQSQSSKGETRSKPRSRNGRPARQSDRRQAASEAAGSELLRTAGVPPSPSF